MALIIRDESKDSPLSELMAHVQNLPPANNFSNYMELCVFPKSFSANGYSLCAISEIYNEEQRPSHTWNGRISQMQSSMAVQVGKNGSAILPITDFALMAFDMEGLVHDPTASADVVIRFESLTGYLQTPAITSVFISQRWSLIGAYALRLFLFQNNIRPFTRIRFTSNSRSGLDTIFNILSWIAKDLDEIAVGHYEATIPVDYQQPVANIPVRITGNKKRVGPRAWESVQWRIPYHLPLTIEGELASPVLVLNMRYALRNQPPLETNDFMITERDCRLEVKTTVLLERKRPSAPPLPANLTDIASVDAKVWFDRRSSKMIFVGFNGASELRNDAPEVVALPFSLKEEIEDLLMSALFTCMRAALFAVEFDLSGVMFNTRTDFSQVLVYVSMRDFVPVHQNFFPNQAEMFYAEEYFLAYPEDRELYVNATRHATPVVARIEHDMHVFAFQQEMRYRLSRVGLKNPSTIPGFDPQAFAGDLSNWHTNNGTVAMTAFGRHVISPIERRREREPDEYTTGRRQRLRQDTRE